MIKPVKPERLFFYTDSGLEVEYEPLSPIVLQEAMEAIERYYRESGKRLNKPTYIVEIAGGGKQELPHDETTIQTEEEKAAWQEYLKDTQALENEQAQTRAEMVIECLKVKLPEDESWKRKYTKRRIPIPEDPDELFQFYVMREVLKTPNDLITAMTSVISASMKGTVSEEQITAASETFRRSVQGAAQQAYQDDSGNQGDVAA